MEIGDVETHIAILSTKHVWTVKAARKAECLVYQGRRCLPICAQL